MGNKRDKEKSHMVAKGKVQEQMVERLDRSAGEDHFCPCTLCLEVLSLS